MSSTAANAKSAVSLPVVSTRTIQADGVEVFFREAGDPSAPAILLLHGFPTSSLMFRELIPRLAQRYRVIAPDLPGFGFTSVPAERNYTYTFESIATTIGAFTEALGLTRFAIYIFDYGAPTGLRLALKHPERITAVVSQNGNAYLEGLGDAWDPIKAYWKEPTQEHRDALRGVLQSDATKWQYTHGAPADRAIDPATYTLDVALMQRPGNADIQLDLFLDYASNLKLYPAFQEYFREYQPPTLAIWGRHDSFFIPAGAEAYKKDNPDATVTLLDTGHFALETHVEEVAAAIDDLLARATR
ncbi:alpha/beta fold hydrolase [Edaphobacter sp. 12200R-103]|jgi:pimeloyl-ACP methyl ester carboxylesterase|uniref:alpha/beta fold hydrolase n=1 Tax=Edaphobacter sp. 12200R-103 TaxID=2703788 RepID=UPI00138BA27A|nr:alpha/beta hydrolase [Edaphobacter sp. 12200R-103]QHS52837.1 alpha/beta hydrolase [Edaphobacter sp. 12200R-103]